MLCKCIIEKLIFIDGIFSYMSRKGDIRFIVVTLIIIFALIIMFYALVGNLKDWLLG